MLRLVATFGLYHGPEGLELARRKVALKQALAEGQLPDWCTPDLIESL